MTFALVAISIAEAAAVLALSLMLVQARADRVREQARADRLEKELLDRLDDKDKSLFRLARLCKAKDATEAAVAEAAEAPRVFDGTPLSTRDEQALYLAEKERQLAMELWPDPREGPPSRHLSLGAREGFD